MGHAIKAYTEMGESYLELIQISSIAHQNGQVPIYFAPTVNKIILLLQKHVITP